MVLVTGATGLAGSHLCVALLRAGKKVRALYRNEARLQHTKEIFSFYGPDGQKDFEQLEWMQADVTDIYSLEDALDRIQEVYHCAGLVSFDEKDRHALYKTNAEGTANLVNACLMKNVEKFCHVSSVATLQVQAHKKYIDELSVWKTDSGNSSYAISKYRGEFEAWRGMAEGLNVVVVNPSLIVGPGCWGQSSSEFITRTYKGIPFYTGGTTGYVDVRDVAACMIRLMEENKFGARYILNAENLSFREISVGLRKFFGKNPPKFEAGGFLLNTARYADGLRSLLTGKKRTITAAIVHSALRKNYYNNSRICKELSYTFRPVQESLAYTAEKYLAYLNMQAQPALQEHQHP